MSKINWGRVVLGGIVFGVVFGIFPAIYIPMLAREWREAFAALGGNFPDTTPAFLAGAGAINIAVGIVTLWLYAAIRPRYGPGPRTAAIAGVAIWLVLLFANLSYVLLTDLTVAHAVMLHGPSLVAFVVAAIAGAWVYREASPQSAAPAREATPAHTGKPTP
ncbi:MAG: hypothetical protein HY705_09680 [Gemmatimonadetes bacterium]|nr:hypothetical protein [Gemmatimonadota bacterium]